MASEERGRDEGLEAEQGGGMKLSRIKELLDCDVLSGANGLDIEILQCLGADMMSDVLAFAEPGSLLVTGLTNSQSVRTAEIADATAIIYLRGKRPERRVLELAEELSIPIMATKLGMFDVCGRLYAQGIKGIC